jgi:Domain of unknown function (DUF5658)
MPRAIRDSLTPDLEVADPSRPGVMPGILRRPVRYPAIYPWIVLVAMLDVMLTWVSLALGGVEINALARAIIDLADMQGALALKCLSVAAFLVLCERVAVEREDLGERLAIGAVGLQCVPVVAALVQLSWHAGVLADPYR